jgi:hypothetical protein
MHIFVLNASPVFALQDKAAQASSVFEAVSFVNGL